MSAKKEQSFTTTVEMPLALRGELDAIRARWSVKSGRRPCTREVILVALEKFVEEERRAARRAA